MTENKKKPPASTWTPIYQAKLSHQDVADLLGVTRFTVLKWTNGQCRPNVLLEGAVERLLETLKAKLADGTLPLDDAGIRDLAREERRRRLRAALS